MQISVFFYSLFCVFFANMRFLHFFKCFFAIDTSFSFIPRNTAANFSVICYKMQFLVMTFYHKHQHFGRLVVIKTFFNQLFFCVNKSKAMMTSPHIMFIGNSLFITIDFAYVVLAIKFRIFLVNHNYRFFTNIIKISEMRKTQSYKYKVN